MSSADTAGPVIYRCWCGAEGEFERMVCDPEAPPCGGLGVLYCYCGGDFCVCHNHGEVECPGCDECGPVDGEEWE